MLSCWQPTRPVFFQLSRKAYCIRAQERHACLICVLVVSVRWVMWGNWPLLITYFVPDLRAPVHPSSGGRCVWAMGLKPQPDTERRDTVCWVPTVGPMTVIHQELVMNPVSHSITAWHVHFLHLSAQGQPNHYPQRLLPSSPSFSTPVYSGQARHLLKERTLIWTDM